jgi:multidrug efflux pump subunit AcrB
MAQVQVPAQSRASKPRNTKGKPTMFLSNFSVKKPVATIVIIVAMMAIGLLALSKLKVNQEPDVEIPIIVVDIPYPGASPETAEREITNRLEKQMQAIQGVKDVNSNSYEGGASIWMEFDFDRDLIEASDDDRNARAGAAPDRSVGPADHVAGAVVEHPEPRRNLALR